MAREGEGAIASGLGGYGIATTTTLEEEISPLWN